MGSSVKLYIWILILIIVVLIGIEIVWRNGECCSCTTKVQVPCPNDSERICSEWRRVNDECCKCSFIKEHFGIDLYSWRNK